MEGKCVVVVVVGRWGYKSSGRPLLSQIISEHLVIVPQRGSKITFLPTLHTSNSLSRAPAFPHVKQTESRPRAWRHKMPSQNATAAQEYGWVGGGGGGVGTGRSSLRSPAAKSSAHHHITIHQRNLRAINYIIPQLLNLCY